MAETILLEKTYDFMKWVLQHTAQFHKSLKFSLGDHLNTLMFGFFDSCNKAYRNKGSVRLLYEMSDTLDTIKYYIRIASDFKQINLKQYEYATEYITEIGKLLVGWIKSKTV